MSTPYYFPVKRGQTELDLTDVKSDGPVALKNTQVTIERDKNRAFTERGLEILSWGDVDVKNPDAVRDRITKFFNDCLDRSIKPTVSALALALGISRETVYRFVRGDVATERVYPADTVSYIRKAYQILDTLWEDYMINGQVNPASGIFLGKNHFGYRDVVDYTISPGAASASPSQEDLDRKYAELPAQDTELTEDPTELA